MDGWMVELFISYVYTEQAICKSHTVLHQKYPATIQSTYANIKHTCHSYPVLL